MRKIKILLVFSLISVFSVFGYLQSNVILDFFYKNKPSSHATRGGVISDEILVKAAEGKFSHDELARFEFSPEDLSRIKKIERFKESDRQDIYNSAKNNVSKSYWLRKESEKYKKIIESNQYDVLPLPCQIEGGAFDLVERSLSTMYINEALRRYGYKSPDPVVLLRALGERERTHSKEDIDAIAKKTGVSSILECRMGHDNGYGLQVSMTLHARNGDGVFTKTGEIVFDVSQYSDTLLPSDILRAKIPEYFEKLSIENKTTDYKNNTEDGKIIPIKSLRDVIAVSDQGYINSAYRLQKIANLYPRDVFLNKYRLYERSLLALSYADKNNTHYRYLMANALFNLHRRPAAIEQLGLAKSPDEKALKDILYGNLTGFDDFAEHRNSSPHVNEIGSLYADIANAYLANPSEKYFDALKPEENAAYVLSVRAKQGDTWQHISLTKLYNELSELFPEIKGGLKDFIKQKQSIGERLGDIDVAIFIKNKIDVLYAKYSENERKNTWNISESDILYMYKSWIDKKLFSAVYIDIYRKVSLESAKSKIDAMSKAYNGHPYLAYLETCLYSELFKNSKTDNDDYFEKYVDATLEAMSWFEGQNYNTASILEITLRYGLGHEIRKRAVEIGEQKAKNANELLVGFWGDFPRRFYFPDTMEAYWVKNYEIVYGNVVYYRLLTKIKIARETGDAGLIDLENELSNRFLGHPDKELNTVLNSASITNDNRIEGLTKIISNGATTWEPYFELGRILFFRGSVDQAFSVMKEFPGYKNPIIKNKLLITNYAGAAANLFYRAGYKDEARYFFDIVTQNPTGSAMEHISSIRTHLFDKKFISVANVALHSAKRYDSAYRYRDFMSALHILGYHQQAWNAFNALHGRYADSVIWESAFLGHRLEKKSIDEIYEWVSSPNINTKKTPPYARNKAQRYMFIYGVTDRKPSLDLISKLNNITKGATRKIYNASGDVVQVEETPESDLAGLARAYIHLKNNNLTESLKAFGDGAKFKSDASARVFGLPYFSWVTAKKGNIQELDKLLELYSDTRSVVTDEKLNSAFYKHLSQGMIFGAKNKHTEAVAEIVRAYHVSPFTAKTPLDTSYQLLEMLEILYLDTKYDKYRELLVSYAKKYQKSFPDKSYTYSFEAKYTNNKYDKKKALAITLFLDEHSERISDFTKAEKKTAKKWFKKNNPFKEFSIEQDKAA